GGLGIAEVRGNRYQPCGIDKAPGLFLASAYPKRQDASPTLLLTLNQRMIGMRRQSAVEHLLHLWLGLKPGGNFQSILAVSPHPHTKRLQSLEKHPGVEWTHGRATGAQEAIYLLHQRIGPHDHAADTAALTIQVFGGGMNDDIRAQDRKSVV